MGELSIQNSDASHFSGAGENISLNFSDDVKLGDVIANPVAGKVEISAHGDITSDADSAIRGDAILVDSEGDIDLNIYANELTAQGGESVNIHSGKSELTLHHLSAGEDVNLAGNGSLYAGDDGMIEAGGNVVLHFLGNIAQAENPLVVDADGKVNAQVCYGKAYVTIIRHGQGELWDNPGEKTYFITLTSGVVEQFTRLGSGIRCLAPAKANLFLWTGDYATCKRLFGNASQVLHIRLKEQGEILFDGYVALLRLMGYRMEKGQLYPLVDTKPLSMEACLLRIPVAESYNGRTFTITLSCNGQVSKIQGTVEHGFITFLCPCDAGEIIVELSSP